MSLSPVKCRKNVVQTLPEDLQSFLRSGVAITSPCQCVEELVLNAIDAKATCIAVRLDLQYFKIQVIDNGIGICPEDLELLGERYTTSKCRRLEDLNNLEFYGFRGEALASMKQVAGVLEIVTRSSSSDKTYCKLFLHGKSTQLSTSVFPRPSQGTTVTAYDFMYNLPVRKKSINNILDVEQIRTKLEAIVLVHPEISLTLRNDSDQTKYLQTMKCSSILSVFSQLFGSKKATRLQSVRNTFGPFTTEGFISVNTSRNKQLQFLYINKRLVLKTKIHKLINDVFSKCLITKPRSNFPFTLNESPKSAESGNCAIFVLNITCQPSEYDICLDPSKTLVEFKDWNTVLRCVYFTVIDFLKKENLMKPNFSELNFAFSEFSEIIISKEINGSKSGMVDFKGKETDNLRKGLCSLLAKRNVSHSCNDSNAVTFLQQCTEDLGKLPDDIINEKLTNEEMKSSKTNVMKSSLNQKNNNEKRKSTSETDSDTKKVKIVLKPNEAIPSVSSLQAFKNQLLKEGKIVKQSKFSTDGFQADHHHVLDKSKGTRDESSSSTVTKNPVKNNLNKHRQKMPISFPSRNQKKRPNILKKLVKRKNCLTAVSNLQKFAFKISPPLKESKSHTSRNSEVKESSVEDNAKSCLPLIKVHGDNQMTENKIKLKDKSCISNCYKSHESTNCECSLCNENKCEKITHPNKNHKFLTTTSLIETAQDKLLINWENDESSYQNNKSEITMISNKRYIGEEPPLDSDSSLLPSRIQNTSDRYFSPPHENSMTEHNLTLPFLSNNYSENDDKLNIKGSDLKESIDDPLPNSVYTPDLHLSQSISPNDQLNETQAFVPLSGNENHSLSDTETLPFNTSYDCSAVDLNRKIQLESEDSQLTHHLLNQERLESSSTKTNETLLNRRKESVSLQKCSEEFERFCIKLSENIRSTDHVVRKINRESGGEKNNIILQSEGFETEHSFPEESESLPNMEDYKIFNNNVGNLKEKGNGNNLITDLIKSGSHNEMINSYKDDTSRNKDVDMLELNDHECLEANFLLSDSYPSAAQPPKQDVTEILDQKEQLNECGFGAFISNSDSLIDSCDGISYIVNKNAKINNERHSEEEDRLEINQGKRLDLNDKIHTVDDDSANKHVIETADQETLNANADQETLNANAEFRVYTENRNWICHEDKITGQQIYIHRTMGNSSFLPPPSDKNSDHENIVFSESASLLGNVSKPFINQEENPVTRKTLPSSSFSHLVNLLCDAQDDETTSNVKWKGQKDKIELASNEMADKFLNWQNPIMRIPYEEIIENAYVQETWSSSIKACNIIHPYKFRKDIFNNYKVLNQVDNKFIACVVNISQSSSSVEQGLIVLFDQHAVHERIRLEQLIADIHQNENLDDFQLNAVQLSPPTDIILNPGEVRIALSFVEVFKKFGIELRPHSVSRNKVIIHSVPKCVAMNELAKNKNQQPIDLALIEKLLHDIIMMVEQTKGANYVLPKTLIQILNSQACHGAVKFGDKLNFKACCSLLNELKVCQLPFQCAHGRPSVVPLVDLDLFQKSHKKSQQSKPKLWKLRRYFQDKDEDNKLEYL